MRAALFPPAAVAGQPAQHAVPDFAALRQQHEKHRELTLELLWEEYREQNPDGYSYSRFCHLYRH